MSHPEVDTAGPHAGPADGVPGDDAERVFAGLREHISPPIALAGKLMGRGAYEASAQGSVVTLSDGRELLDLSSYAVALFGHRHPAVVAAVIEQLGIQPTSTRVLGNPVQAAFATELTAALGAPYDHVWIGTDGADAVEAVLKLARRASGRPRILAVQHAFHGKSLGALGVTANPGFRIGLEGVVGHAVTHLDPADPAAVAREVSAGDVAGLIFEPVRGEAGVLPMDVDLLRRWQDDARAAGAFVIADEVQVGFGRCGPLSVALDDGLAPDAILFGKPIGGGVLPLSTVAATRALMAPLLRDGTFHSLTFGGHPLACAAGRAALRLQAELAPDGARIAAAFAERLPRIAAAYPDVFTEVRGRGLLWGLDLRTPAIAGEILLFLAEHGVLACPCFSSKTVLRLFPPLTLTPAESERVFGAIEQAASDCREQVLQAAEEEPAWR